MTDATIVQRALAITDPVERKRFLASACVGNSDLRRKIEKLTDLPSATDQPHNSEQADSATQRLVPSPQLVSSPSNWESAYSYLEPPQRPESLGRLGHYEILSVLGEGGFGTVFKAIDDELNRVVAIKTLHADLAVTSPARKRFVREARAAAPIRHLNVVQVHAIESEPVPYLVMEFVPGKSLQQVLDENGPIPAEEVVKYGIQIAYGLAAAHAIGVIHRDVKPANILIDAADENRIKLTDFGLARAADDASLTRSGVIAGTPHYMSPEQALGETLDHRSDLFSLGSVLYTLCTGHPPFRAETSLAVMRRVADDTPRPIQDLIPETPTWLCEVIAKLHAKNRADRYQSAKELANALEQGESLAKVSATTVPIVPVRQPRSPWVWVVGLVSAIVLGGAVAAIIAFNFNQPSAVASSPSTPGSEPTKPTQPETKPTTQPVGPRPISSPVQRLSSAQLREKLTSPDYVWETPTLVPGAVNTGGRETSPWLTDDELEIVFCRQSKIMMANAPRGTPRLRRLKNCREGSIIKSYTMGFASRQMGWNCTLLGNGRQRAVSSSFLSVSEQAELSRLPRPWLCPRPWMVVILTVCLS